MPEPGDVVLVNLPGAVVTKRRPAVVISSQEYHANRPDVIVGVVTSQIAKATAPSDYLIVQWDQAGLKVPSAFRAFLWTVPRTAIITTFGRLQPSDWQAVSDRVKRAIAQ